MVLLLAQSFLRSLASFTRDLGRPHGLVSVFLRGFGAEALDVGDRVVVCLGSGVLKETHGTALLLMDGTYKDTLRCTELSITDERYGDHLVCEAELFAYSGARQPSGFPFSLAPG